jgi:ABC-type phosphate/phosphonate transport system substrate-binding protein
MFSRLSGPHARIQTQKNKFLIAGISAGAAMFLSTPAIPQALAQTSLVLAVQPIQSEEKTAEIFQPMADYIQVVTGIPTSLNTYPNFISYWSTTQQAGSYNLVLDAAHFTDYRVINQGFTPMVKQEGSVTFSLIVGEDSLVFDPEELIGKKIATLGAPSVGAVRLNEIFDNPIRQPLMVETNNSAQAMDLLIAGEVDAAMLPTPIVSQRMSGDGGINVVMTTDPLPSVALSASPDVDAAIIDKLRKAFLDAGKTDAGKTMLNATNLPAFESADAAVYENQAELLEDF